MHDQTAVYIEHTLAHVNVLFQKWLQFIGCLQKEDVRGVGDESLQEKNIVVVNWDWKEKCFTKLSMNWTLLHPKNNKKLYKKNNQLFL